MKSLSLVKKQKHIIEVEEDKKKEKYVLQELPEEFIKWQINERIQLFDFLKNKKEPNFFNPHLSTLITINKKKLDFSINAACKGIGLVPNDNELIDLTNKIEKILKVIAESDFTTSIQKRIDGVMLLYGFPKKINHFSLGGLEIFETQSYKKILKNPFVSLFYVDGSPIYKSYQINCIAEIIEKNNPFYKFMISMRTLFEKASFHYQQPSYPYAIKYNVIEVLDKSLKIRGK